jgi:hypothetical protein
MEKKLYEIRKNEVKAAKSRHRAAVEANNNQGITNNVTIGTVNMHNHSGQGSGIQIAGKQDRGGKKENHEGNSDDCGVEVCESESESETESESEDRDKAAVPSSKSQIGNSSRGRSALKKRSFDEADDIDLNKLGDLSSSSKHTQSDVTAKKKAKKQAADAASAGNGRY